MIRRIIGQIHLWTGLLLFVPLVLLGLTGSILVFEDELNKVFGPRHGAAGGAPRPTSEIIAAARAVAPAGFVPVGYTAPVAPGGLALVRLSRGGEIPPAWTWFASGLTRSLWKPFLKSQPTFCGRYSSCTPLY